MRRVRPRGAVSVGEGRSHVGAIINRPGFTKEIIRRIILIYENIEQTIGHTPLVRLSRFSQKRGLTACLLAKTESRNPGGSIKDRASVCMVDAAERAGLLRPGGVIIEPTSGNTGIGLAVVAAVRGYRLILTMPDSMSAERRALLAAYGAHIVLTPGAEGMAGAIARGKELLARHDDGWMPSQFDNPQNHLSHEATTGPEIWADTEGRVDCIVCGVGTGGTLTGTARFLRAKNPALHVVAVEPADSPLLSGGKAGSHALQGIGANFVPPNLDRSLIGEVVAVTTDEAFAAARDLVSSEGILGGISSGAALHAAALTAARPDFADKTVVVILPDGGEKYLSTPLFEQETV